MSVPIKISSIITNGTPSDCCKPNGTACTTGDCWRHKNNPTECQCSSTGRPGRDWEKNPKTTTEMQMMAEQMSLVSMTPRENCGWKCLADLYKNGSLNGYRKCQSACDMDETVRQGDTWEPVAAETQMLAPLAPPDPWLRWPPRSCEGKCIDNHADAMTGLRYQGLEGQAWVNAKKEIDARRDACMKACSDARIRQWGIGHM